MASSKSMKNNLLLALILAGFTGATASVQAQDGTTTTAPELSPAHKLKGFEKEFDANHDGKLDEMKKRRWLPSMIRMGTGRLIRRSCLRRRRKRVVLIKTELRTHRPSKLLL